MPNSIWRSASLRAVRLVAVLAVSAVAFGWGAPLARAASAACTEQCNTDHSACNANCNLLRPNFTAVLACTQHCTTVFFACVNACP